NQPAETWDCTYDQPGTAGILGVTAGGAIGESLNNLAQSQAVTYGVNLGTTTFPLLRSEFASGVAIRWGRDAWSRGAVGGVHAGQMTAMMPTTGRGEGRMHFAGERTSAGMGWMEGALESGERAAREILA